MTAKGHSTETKETSKADQQKHKQGVETQSIPHLLQRAYADPSTLTPNNVQQLQRTVGNRATVQLLNRALPIQAKLTLGAANDQYEQEADQVAEQVVRKLDSKTVQRHNDEKKLQMKPAAADISRLQRTPAEPMRRAFVIQRDIEEEEMVQGKYEHGPEGGEVEPSVTRQIQAARGGGRPLDEGVRSSMESGFGADFSNVRVHTGTQADTLNRSLNARAFTVGRDIFFKAGEYNAGSSGGKKLLAHELTHTVQQGAAGVQRREQPIQRAMAFENTNWDSVTSTRFNGGGAGGVFIMYDNPNEEPIVVKSAKLGADQLGNKVFSDLFQSSISDQGLGEAGEGKNAWALQTPSVRFADQNEVGRIVAAVNRTVGPENIDPESKMGKAFEAIQNLQNTTTIYSYAQGKDFTSYYRDTDKSKKERKKVVSKLWENPGMMTLLGRTAALDIFVGNDDRLLSNFNPDNFMVHITKGRQVMTLIDNSDGIMSQFIGDQNIFNAWERKAYLGNGEPYFPVRLMGQGNTQEIAVQIVSKIIEQSLGDNGSGASEDIRGGMAKPLQKNREIMIQNFAAGLQQARTGLLRGVAQMINGMRRNENMSDRERDALRDLIARYYVLRGESANAAWQTAVELTTVQVPQQQNPLQQQQPREWQAPNMGGNRGNFRIGNRRQVPQVNN
jgi:hypothetical protein